ERADDIPELASRILTAVAKTHGRRGVSVSAAALRALMIYPWPGNIRELENVLTKAVLLSEGGVLGPAALDLPSTARMPVRIGDRAEFEQDEAARILSALQAHRWNVTAAGKALGIPRPTLYRKLARYRTERPAKGATPRPRGNSTGSSQQ